MCNATRYLSTLLAILLVAGCSGDSTTDTTLAATTTTDRATTTTAEATTAPLQDSGSFEVTTTVVSHETTQDMWCLLPTVKVHGRWWLPSTDKEEQATVCRPRQRTWQVAESWCSLPRTDRLNPNTSNKTSNVRIATP